MGQRDNERAIERDHGRRRHRRHGVVDQEISIELLKDPRFASVPPLLSIVSGISRKVSTSPAAPMQARPRNATLLPSRSLIHPASVVLSEAPMPIPLPTMPCARLKRPVPRVMSAMVSGTSTPNRRAAAPPPAGAGRPPP